MDIIIAKHLRYNFFLLLKNITSDIVEENYDHIVKYNCKTLSLVNKKKYDAYLHDLIKRDDGVIIYPKYLKIDLRNQCIFFKDSSIVITDPIDDKLYYKELSIEYSFFTMNYGNIEYNMFNIKDDKLQIKFTKPTGSYESYDIYLNSLGRAMGFGIHSKTDIYFHPITDTKFSFRDPRSIVKVDIDITEDEIEKVKNILLPHSIELTLELHSDKTIKKFAYSFNSVRNGPYYESDANGSFILSNFHKGELYGYYCDTFKGEQGFYQNGVKVGFWKEQNQLRNYDKDVIFFPFPFFLF